MGKIKGGGIIQNTDVARIDVRSVPDRPAIAGAVLSILGNKGINVEFIVHCRLLNSGTYMIICVNDDDLQEVLSSIEGVKSEIGLESVVSQSNVAIVSIYGPNFRDYPGIAGLACSTLDRIGVNIMATCTSISTISYLIDENRLSDAVNSLMEAFDIPASSIFAASRGISPRVMVRQGKS
jgi:aspartate kinase